MKKKRKGLAFVAIVQIVGEEKKEKQKKLANGKGGRREDRTISPLSRDSPSTMAETDRLLSAASAAGAEPAGSKFLSPALKAEAKKW